MIKIIFFITKAGSLWNIIWRGNKITMEFTIKNPDKISITNLVKNEAKTSLKNRANNPNKNQLKSEYKNPVIEQYLISKMGYGNVKRYDDHIHPRYYSVPKFRPAPPKLYGRKLTSPSYEDLYRLSVDSQTIYDNWNKNYNGVYNNNHDNNDVYRYKKYNNNMRKQFYDRYPY